MLLIVQEAKVKIDYLREKIFKGKLPICEPMKDLKV